MNTKEAEIFDIAVAGGGIVGLVFAGLLCKGLKQAGSSLPRVALLEPDPPQTPLSDADIDLRVSAISPASRRVLENAGIWLQLPASKVSPYEQMCVWQSGNSATGRRSIHFSAAELGEPNLGYVIENRAIRAAAWEQAAAGLQIFSASSVVSVTEQQDYCSMTFANGEQIKARLVVGADGVNSLVRQQMGVSYRDWSHGQSAIVAHVKTGNPHAATAVQSFLPGGPVALLPLADGRSSLVWSCPTEQAEQLLEMDVAAFDRLLSNALEGVPGDVHCTTRRVAFPLSTGYAECYTGRRYALIGDAAHRVHPLAGQGVNLGLLDAATLAEVLIEHLVLPQADPGDPLALRRFERKRKAENLLVLGAMDAINRVFRSRGRDIAGRGLGVVDRLTPLKARLARYAMGRGGALPAAARSSGAKGF